MDHQAEKKHIVPLKHVTTLAVAIAESTRPQITLPPALVTVTKAVLTLRKKCGTIFSKLAKSNARVAAASKAHRHFEGVLENVLDLLSPAAEGSAGASADPSQVDLSNMFAALSVEEPSAKMDSQPPGIRSKTKAPPVEPKYEIESERFDDIFAILAFFDDIREIRQYVMECWTGYRQVYQCSMSASVTTDTAMLVIKQMCEDVVERLPGKVTYETMVQKLVNYLEAHCGGVDEAAISELTCAYTVHHLAGYCEVLEPEELPVYKPGHFGQYNAHVKRSDLSAQERFQEDMIVLHETLPQFTKLARYKIEVPAEDMLTKALREMMNASNFHGLPMYGIFATQIFLDIHHVLRQDHTRPLLNLQNTSRRIVCIFDDWFKFSRNRAPFANWPPQNDEIFRATQATAREWALDDFMSKIGVRASGSEKVVLPSFHLLRQHPTLCGLMEFRLNMLFQTAGETLVTAWGSLYPAHLYNACKQSAGLDQGWDNMDFVLKIHTPSRIFVGAPPTDPVEYLKRFVLSLGASASKFARNRRPGGHHPLTWSKKGPRGLKTTSPIRDIWRRHYVYGDQAPALNAANVLAMVAVASKAERVSPPSVEMDDFVAEMRAQKSFSTIQLLTAVREGVAGEELSMLFNYIGLHMRSMKLLRELQTHLQHDLTSYFGSDYLENESQLPFIIGYIFEVGAGTDRAAEALGIDQDTRGSALLFRASEVMGRYLSEYKVRRAGLLEATAYTYGIMQSHFDGTL